MPRFELDGRKVKVVTYAHERKRVEETIWLLSFMCLHQPLVPEWEKAHQSLTEAFGLLRMDTPAKEGDEDGGEPDDAKPGK